MCSEDVFSLRHVRSGKIYYYCFDFRQTQTIYFLSETVRRALEHTQPPIQRVPGGVSPEGKENEERRSPQISV
jgi:hypothetical protein